MIDAILGGANAASSLAGTIAGIMQRNDANSIARAQNDLQYQQFYQQQRLARLQEEMARAGSVDARGNRTEYVPGVGWVERPTAQTAGLIAASDNEQQKRLGEDALRNRLLRQDTFRRQQGEGQLADAMLGGINEGRQTQDDLRAAMIEAGVARAMSGANDARGRIGMISLRTGSGGQEALAQLGRQGMADTRTAIAEARLNSPGEFVSQRGDRVNNTLNPYQALRSSSSAPSDVQFEPTTLDQSLSQYMRSRANLAPQAIGSAMSVRAPQLGYSEDKTPAALSNLGAFFSGLNKMGQNNDWWGENRSRTASRDDRWSGSAAP